MPHSVGLVENGIELIGYLKGSYLSARNLLTITGKGDFTIETIELVESNTPLTCEEIRNINSSDSMDEDNPKNPKNYELKLMSIKDENSESLQALLEPDNSMGFEADEPTNFALHENDKRDIQSAWNSAVEGDDAFDNISILGVDEEDEKRQLLARARDALEFPDEVDTPIDQSAKSRFIKYRGLANFRTSPWDPRENLPEEYSRIFEFEDFDKTAREFKKEDDKICQSLAKSYLNAKNNTLNSEMVTEDKEIVDGVLSGCQIRVVVSMNTDMAKVIKDSKQPIICSSLYPHEHKISVVHFLMRRRGDYLDPIKGKTLLTISCGFRRFICRPVFSEDGPNPHDKFLIDRYFHVGRFTIFTCYAPVMYPPAPVLAFLPNMETCSTINDKTFYDLSTYIASGSLSLVSPMRLNIKRIILTGYCVRVHKRGAVVRFMFFNVDDIKWFSPVPLKTKFGLVGEIKEPLGTKGYFKCVFNDAIKQNDTVCMHLYKRQYPKWDEECINNLL